MYARVFKIVKTIQLIVGKQRNHFLVFEEIKAKLDSCSLLNETACTREISRTNNAVV